ncbi:leishmanolysin-like peptidase isoform X3 [Xenia sp. Carnegie-2017]|uniref:leishmanolysin-like peptidase isoform X3 n=1 Tax=Xenia sp. Carnegie-2017 TaxID=2897299 RepID=UPI001F03F926|nr:leishmanolysin-like peptidase isoform X3 [Xenia sp. Carnegie-2017]
MASFNLKEKRLILIYFFLFPQRLLCHYNAEPSSIIRGVRGDAYASSCQQEQRLDRPVAGFVNFCPEAFMKKLHFSHLLAITKHEIFHALGFSSLLFAYYRMDNGHPLTPRLHDGRPAYRWSDKVIKDVTRQRWLVSERAGGSVVHKVRMIITPRVVKEARLHFNCSILEGAEIENQGSSGQIYTHLEKRVFENEAMTGVFTNNPVFSRITLAIMEDSGWYWANYNMAEELDWGRNFSCAFAMNSCKYWMDYQMKANKSIAPYCTQLSKKDQIQTGCTHSRGGVGVCNLFKYKHSLPLEYQYFDSLPGVGTPSHYGGAIILADYCPYYQELDWKSEGKVVRNSYCKCKLNNPTQEKNYALEVYGDNAICFRQGKAWTRKSCSHSSSAKNWGSGCYLYSCTIDGLVLNVGGKSFHCSYAEQVIDVKLLFNGMLHEGSIICPHCNDVCSNSCSLTNLIKFNSSSVIIQEKSLLVCSCNTLHYDIFIMLLLMVIISLVKT